MHFWITGNLPFLVKLWAMVQNKIAFMGEKLIESFAVPRLLPGQYYKKENHVHGGWKMPLIFRFVDRFWHFKILVKVKIGLKVWFSKRVQLHIRTMFCRLVKAGKQLTSFHSVGLMCLAVVQMSEHQPSTMYLLGIIKIYFKFNFNQTFVAHFTSCLTF